MLLRLPLAAVALAACLLGSAHPVLAQDGGTIRIVFPFAAGGVGDALARMVGDKLRAVTGKAVIIENRTGGAGRPGVQAVRSAEPNGNTLLFTPIAPMSVYPHFYKQLGYDPVADFEPLSQHVTFEFALAVASRVPAKTARELVAWLKANPSEANFGTPAIGTLPHFLGLRFSELTGTGLRHVSYRGSAAAIQDVVAGQLPIVITSTGEFAAQHEAGRLRVIATTEPQPFIPAVPTFEQEGFALRGNGWYAMYAPARTPVAILDQYSKALSEAALDPQNRPKLIAMGFQPTGTTRQRLAEIQKADLAFWGPIIKASGYVPEQ